MVDEVRDSVALGRGTWVVGTAHPRTPIPPYAPTLARDELMAVFQDALRVASEIGSRNSWRPEVMRRPDSSDIASPGIGLRRWIVRRGVADQDGLSNEVHVELRHDGASVFAADIESWLGRTDAVDHAVPTRHVEAVIADTVAVATAHARRLGYDGSDAVQVTVLRAASDDKPLVAGSGGKVSGSSRDAARAGAGGGRNSGTSVSVMSLSSQRPAARGRLAGGGCACDVRTSTT